MRKKGEILLMLLVLALLVAAQVPDAVANGSGAAMVQRATGPEILGMSATTAVALAAALAAIMVLAIIWATQPRSKKRPPVGPVSR